MRITEKMLKGAIDQLNEVTGNPVETRTPEGSVIGAYSADYGYGGVKLVKFTNENGAINVISEGGRLTKRELFNQVHTVLRFLKK